MKSKRKNFLTILLIIILIAIANVVGYLGYELVNSKIKEKNSQSIVDEFDSQIPTITEDELAEEQLTEEGSSAEEGQSSEEGTGTGGSSSSSGGSGYGYSSGYYSNGITIDGYNVVGIIRIPASGIRYAIFSKPTKAALDRGTGIVYTSNGLNQTGNTVIAGHNYRNNLFFSKNKYLVEGNPIYIKDTTGVEKKYVVSKVFTTTSTDTSFYQRDTNGKCEITLTTCTDNGSVTGKRVIVQAVEQ